MIKLIVPSIIAYGHVHNEQLFCAKLSGQGSPSERKSPNCEGKAKSLVSNGWGAWLSDMANISELSLTHRKVVNKPKDTGLEPKGTQSDNLEPCGVTRTKRLPVYRQSLSHSLSLAQNTVNPYSSLLRGKRAARQAELDAGIGLWKKRKSVCNGLNRDFNVIPCESRQTSTLGNSLQETFRTF
jgi:hypothetical protein